MNLSLFHNEGLGFKDDFEQNITQIFSAIAIPESPPCLTYRLLVTQSGRSLFLLPNQLILDYLDNVRLWLVLSSARHHLISPIFAHLELLQDYFRAFLGIGW